MIDFKDRQIVNAGVTVPLMARITVFGDGRCRLCWDRIWPASRTAVNL